MTASERTEIKLNRAQRRAILKPWKRRKADRERDRERAAWTINFNQRVMQALREAEAAKEQSK